MCSLHSSTISLSHAVKIKKVEKFYSFVVVVVVEFIESNLNGMSKTELLSLCSILSKIKTRQLTCVQTAEAFLENIEKKSSLNALIFCDKKQVLDEACKLDKELTSGQPRGRLHGGPLVVKDNIHIKGIPNTAGSAVLRSFIPTKDSPVIGKLRREGCLFIGKCNMHEFAFGVTSDNPIYGAVRNPHNIDYIAGGSSGGTGAAIASRQAPAGLGTDTCGSVRIPASVNGILGLRPSVGRYSIKGVTPLSQTRDTIGPMASHVEDLMLLDEVMSGDESYQHKQNQTQLDGLRIGIPRGYLCASLDPDVEQAFENSKKVFAQHHAQLVEVDMEKIQTLDERLGFMLIHYETRTGLDAYLSEHGIDLTLGQLIDSVQSRDVLRLFRKYLSANSLKLVKQETYENGLSNLRPRLMNEYRQLFATNRLDILAYPALPCLPIRFEEINEPATDLIFSRNQNLSGNLGTPSVCLPMGKSRKLGLPIGLQLDSLWMNDSRLLKIASLASHCLSSS
jgi:Asp-tRNA(Asn)/Glu-tRNA(Gln) amidotransferase A subunit family amidase